MRPAPESGLHKEAPSTPESNGLPRFAPERMLACARISRKGWGQPDD